MARPCVCLLLAACLAATAVSAFATTHPEFTVVVMSDWQFPYLRLIEPAAEWVTRNKDLLNIVFVSNEGDLGPDGYDPWMKYSYDSMSKLDGIVPYGIAAGNHCVGDAIEVNGAIRDLYWPFSKFEQEPWFGGSYTSANTRYTYQVVEAGDFDLCFVHLAFWDFLDGEHDTDTNLAPAVADWVSNVVQAHSNHVTIMGWHAVRRPFTTMEAPWTDVPPKRPHQIAQSNLNVVMTWHGHWHDDRGFSSTNAAGALLPNIVHNCWPIMYYYVFRPDEGEICKYRCYPVEEDNVRAGDYKTWPDYQYVYAYDFGLPPRIARAWTRTPTAVRVLFNKALQAGGATNPANYGIDGGIVVSSVQLTAAPGLTINTTNGPRTQVELTTSPLATGTTYTLTVSNVVDMVGTPMAPDTHRAFRAGSGAEIRGRVTTIGSSNPVPGARVVLLSRGQTALTDGSGCYTLTNVPPGDYGIAANRDGFLLSPVVTNRVTVGTLNVTNIDFTDAPPRNLINNGGAETADLYAWEPLSPEACLAGPGRRGRGCLRDASCTTSGFRQVFRTLPGQAYEASAWLSIATAGTTTDTCARITVRNSNLTVVARSAERTDVSDWSQLDVCFTAVVGKSVLCLEKSGEECMEVFWDDVSVVPAGLTPVNLAPRVEPKVNAEVEVGVPLVIDYWWWIDNLPDGTLTAGWTRTSGPGNATFSNDGWLPKSVVFDEVGTNALRFTVSDAALTTTNDRRVVVVPYNPPPTVWITDPTNGTRYSSGTLVIGTAYASDSDEIAHGLFFFGNRRGTKDWYSPYQWGFHNATAGVYRMYVYVFDTKGKKSTATVSVVVLPPITDIDDDGMDDGWEMLHFTNLWTAGEGTDWDGDGQSDREEFLADTLPRDADSGLAASRIEISRNPGHGVIAWPAATTRTYAVYWSTNLAEGFTLLTNQLITETGATMSFTNPAQSDVGFYRISADR